MSDLILARFYVGSLAAIMAALALFLALPWTAPLIQKLPRAKYLGIVLSAVCWAWVVIELTCHPIDMIPFSTRTIQIIGIFCIPFSWVLLRNLLCARAVGGLMMLWPMPVFLAVREQVTLWRLVPVVIGYISLIAGMITVFHPWTFRVVCDTITTSSKVRKGFVVGFALAAVLSVVCLFKLGKVLGE